MPCHPGCSLNCIADSKPEPARDDSHLFMGGDLLAIHARWGTINRRHPDAAEYAGVPRGCPAADFPVGSVWEYFGRMVRVVESPKQARDLRDPSLGFSASLDTGRATHKGGVRNRKIEHYIDGPRSWFVQCEYLSGRERGKVAGVPPGAMAPVATCNCCSAVRCCRDPLHGTQRLLDAEMEFGMQLRRERDEARRERDELRRKLDKATSHIQAVQRALRNA
jgi:hypothetical protein